MSPIRNEVRHVAFSNFIDDIIPIIDEKLTNKTGRLDINGYVKNGWYYICFKEVWPDGFFEMYLRRFQVDGNETYPKNGKLHETVWVYRSQDTSERNNNISKHITGYYFKNFRINKVHNKSIIW